MDPKMELAILKYISAVMGQDAGNILGLKDNTFFVKVLTQIDENFQDKIENDCSPEKVLKYTKAFLEDYYSNAEDVLNFGILTSRGHIDEELVKLELAKIAVSLLCVGILDKNGQVFIDAALALPLETQENVLAILKSVLAPDSRDVCLTKDMEDVLMGITGNRSATPVSNLLHECRAEEQLPWKSPICPPHMRSTEGSANVSLLNASLGSLTSPFKSLDISASSPSSFVEFIQSPQLVQKAVLKQKDIELRRLRQQLNSEILLKEEYRLSAEENQAANKLKDTELDGLHQRVTELLAERGSQETLSEMKLKLQAANEEAASLREKISELLHFKVQHKVMEKENKSMTEDLRKLQREVSRLRMEHQVQSDALASMELLERQLERQASQIAELTVTRDQLEQVRQALQGDLIAATECTDGLRQEMVNLREKHEEEVAARGESMDVVLDIQMKELKKELEEVQQERDTLKQQAQGVRSALSGSKDSLQCVSNVTVKTSNLDFTLKQVECNSSNESVVKISKDDFNSIAASQQYSNNLEKVCKDVEMNRASLEHPNGYRQSSVISGSVDAHTYSSLDIGGVVEVSTMEESETNEKDANAFEVGLPDMFVTSAGDSKDAAYRGSCEDEETELFNTLVLDVAQLCLRMKECSTEADDDDYQIYHIPKEMLFTLWSSSREKDRRIKEQEAKIEALCVLLRKKRIEDKKFMLDFATVLKFFGKHGYSATTIVRCKRRINALCNHVKSQNEKMLRIQKLLSEKTREIASLKACVAEQEFSTSGGTPATIVTEGQLENAECDVSAKGKEVGRKENLWIQAREDNQALSQALSLVQDTVVKMRARLDTKESELERAQSELRETRKMLEACREDLNLTRSHFAALEQKALEDATLDCTSSPDLLRKSFISERNPKETSKLYMRVNSAPVLPRQTSTASLQSVRSLMEYHSAFLPNAQSCAPEPESPQFEWNTLSRLKNKEKSDVANENRKPKRKGLAALPENITRPTCQGSPAKQRRKSGGTTVYFPLDPNGPVYPPAQPSDQFHLTSRRLVSPPHYSKRAITKSSATSSSPSASSTPAVSLPSPHA